MAHFLASDAAAWGIPFGHRLLLAGDAPWRRLAALPADAADDVLAAALPTLDMPFVAALSAAPAEWQPTLVRARLADAPLLLCNIAAPGFYGLATLAGRAAVRRLVFAHRLAVEHGAAAQDLARALTAFPALTDLRFLLFDSRCGALHCPTVPPRQRRGAHTACPCDRGSNAIEAQVRPPHCLTCASCASTRGAAPTTACPRCRGSHACPGAPFPTLVAVATHGCSRGLAFALAPADRPDL